MENIANPGLDPNQPRLAKNQSNQGLDNTYPDMPYVQAWPAA
jgi:hypothetical protein